MMLKAMQKNGWLFFLLMLNSQCIEPITIKLSDNGKEQMVIYGRITDQDESNYVTVYRTINDANQPRPISGATVTVTADDLTTYTFQESKPGLYEMQPGPPRQPGHSYLLNITLLNGTTYQSKAEVMPTYIGTDSLTYSISEETFESADFSRLLHKLYVNTKTELPIKGDYFLRWETDEVYYWNLTDFPDPFNTPPPDCIASDRVDPQRINLINGNLVNEGTLNQLVAERELDYTFKSRHYLIVRQFSISENSFLYWNNVKTLLNNTGSPFDIPPATLQGNIRNVSDTDEQVLGYFEAARQSNKRFFLVPGFIPYYIEPLCDYVPGQDINRYKPICLDCGLMPNSSNTIPPWFM